ncbi:MAG TPA: DHH family phosphoesterase [Bacillota bacterium]|nr:DHH family phosphoesterase [Bacillota bacterium]
MTMNSLGELADVIGQYKDVTIIGHLNPDGDTLGSTLALGLGLQQLGKQVVMVNRDKVPGIYRFLPGAEELVTPEPRHFQERLIIFVDCTDTRRSGDEVSELLGQASCIVNIDHHISNEMFGQYNHVDTEAAAAGTVIWALLKELGVKPDARMATCVYVALVTDTGSFRYTNTNANCHHVAAELFQYGIEQETVNRELYEEVPLTSLEVVKVGLENLHISPDGRVAWIILTQETMDRLKAEDEHLEGVVNYAKSVKGVEVGLLFREAGSQLTKVSLRSKSLVNVSQLAAGFGGGGHARAAGCRVKDSLKQAVEKVVKAAVEAAQVKI